jgi:WD40 repeat protein
MAFSSERLAIAYANTLVVWDIVKTDVPTFISIKDVTTLAFSPDGKRLATASRDGTVRILLVEPNDLIVRAKHFANRSLSLEECESYQVRRCPKAKLAERQVTGVRRTDDLCGKDVDYTVKPGGGNIRLLGVWTGNWNASHHLCGALIVQQIDQNGTADVIYVYGGSNLSWTKQQQVGRVTGEVLSFNDQEGNTFRFHPGAPGELEANFISQSGRLSGTFQELN